MLTLGDILGLTRRSAAALEHVDLPEDLRRRMHAAAAAEHDTPERLVRVAVAEFAREASPTEWSTLMSRLRDASDPAATCLEAMIERRLAARGRGPARVGSAEEQHARAD